MSAVAGVRQVSGDFLAQLLGCTQDSPTWQEATHHLDADPGAWDTRAYSDVHFWNLRKCGVSFQFVPTPPTPTLVTIDVYNSQPGWGPYPGYPIMIPHVNEQGAVVHFTLQPSNTAKNFVMALGEPQRKGGGEAGGPTAKALGPGMWLEWSLPQAHGRTPLYMLVEFGGEAARAKDRWELGRGDTAEWATVAVSISQQ
ncbi:hypothetical protein MSPP1_002419 [Malassezia sp. CBS 17886]|nr:hypothetical protein MSPP1_002419 [Malassezia sp. CBS 17886]